MKLIYNNKACYGCRTCELACSFHHSGTFQPAKSSIKVTRDHLTGEIEWMVDSSCDECENEKEPLCIKFCFYEAIKSENI